MSLLELISCSVEKRHDLLTWTTLNFGEAVKAEEDDQDSPELEKIQEIHNQINLLARYLADADDSNEIDSHYIFTRISQLYTICLQQLQHEHPESIFDSAELMAKVLSEDDVSIETDDEKSDQEKKKKKKKKANMKKSYTHSPAKDLAIVILIQLFEVFGRQLSSLIPLLLSTIFKNLKKMLEKSKYMHATFVTSLMQLTNAMLRSGNMVEFSNSYFSKFSKISKSVFEALYSDEEDFPVDFVAAIIEIWSIHFKQESFIRDHTGSLPTVIFTKYCEGELGLYGFMNDRTRPKVAKSLAEVLFDYYYVKKLLPLRDIWRLYSKVFNHASTRDIQAGCFESVIHFIGLCSIADSTFLDGCKYLDIFRSLSVEILSEAKTKSKSMDALYRYLRYFENMHGILLNRINDASKTQTLFQVLGSQVESKIDQEHDMELAVSSKLEYQWFNIAQLELARRLIADLSSSYGNEVQHIKQMKEKLIELSTCEIFSIRIHANEVLKEFLKSFPELLTEIIESSLEALSTDFKLSDSFTFPVNHGHALIIANLIESSDKDYVSYELIMRITVFATIFIKKHTTSTSSTLYYKGIICWILLIGLVGYKDEQYVMMQSSQLFLFWKVLLTHSFVYHGEDELYKNLEIRNHALTCLLSYIGNARIDKELAKQISYLLIKCSNFNHSITLKTNSINKALLTNEHRVLQIYLRLHEYIKSDFSSSLLILIVKNFSDPNLYIEASQSVLKAIKNAGDKKSAVKDSTRDEKWFENSVDNILRSNDEFAFGISSKVDPWEIEELCIKMPRKSNREISGNWPSKKYYWYEAFEREVTKPITPVLTLDYLILLYGSACYTNEERYSPRVTTSLIDSSMEIFSLVFPFLNAKIQYSIIENLNVSMFSKLTSPLRSVAVAANVCVALNSTLSIIHDNALLLDPSVGQLMIDSLKKIEFFNDTYLMKLKADCIGLICSAVNRTEERHDEMGFGLKQIGILIKNVVDIEEPYLRILNALSLAAIYKYNSQITPFNSIYEVISTLVQDPHPVVHAWSLKSMHILLERHLSIDLATVSQLLNTLESVSCNPLFGVYGSSILRFNYSRQFNSQLIVAQIMKTLTETLGPNIIELDKSTLDSYRNLTLCFLTSNDIISQNLGLAIYNTLATYKLSGIVFDQLFMTSATSIVSEGVVLGFGSTYSNCRLTGSHEIFSNDSSMLAAFDCFKLFAQLRRLERSKLFAKDLDIWSWRYLDLYSTSSSVVAYFVIWLDQSCSSNERWFDQLYQFFNMNRKRLFASFFNEFDSLLLAEGYNKTEEREIRGEEERSIAQISTGNNGKVMDDLSDTVHWEAKKVVLELIKFLCSKTQESEKVFALLCAKIPEMIRISFQASVSRVASMKLLGLELLRMLLMQYSSIRDPQNKDHSILELEEAQITSALMPAFDTGSPPDVIISAINVCAELLSSNIVPLERVSRVSKIMVSFLDVYDQKKTEIRIGDARVITQKAMRKTELAILNAWSKLVEKALESKDENLISFTREYWAVLVPLWIISLRDYVMVKYESVDNVERLMDSPKASFYESRSTKLELYDGTWLNFAIALGSILETDMSQISNCLNKLETDSFMFILFTQCIEVIGNHIDNHNIKLRVLPALHNILKCHISLDSLFEDEINEEVVGILDRLMLMGDYGERQILIKIIGDLIVGYTRRYDTRETFLPKIDKLYELLRLLIIPISEILPFIKYNSLQNNDISRSELDEANINLLRCAFNVFESSISRFDDIFKADLYACLLYIVGRIYADAEGDILIPLVLPLLKSIAQNLAKMQGQGKMLDVFYQASKMIIFEKINAENRLATMLTLLGNSYIGFTLFDLRRGVDILITGLCGKETINLAIQGLKMIANQALENECCAFVFKNTMKRSGEFINKDSSKDIVVGFLDVLMTFTKKMEADKPKEIAKSFSLYLNLLIFTYEQSSTFKQIVTEKVVDLIKLNSHGFKEAFSSFITESQKEQIEYLLESSPEFAMMRKSKLTDKIALKSFK